MAAISWRAPGHAGGSCVTWASFNAMSASKQPNAIKTSRATDGLNSCADLLRAECLIAKRVVSGAREERRGIGRTIARGRYVGTLL